MAKMVLLLKSSMGINVSENMINLVKDKYSIGRDARNDIFLNDIFISRFHAEVYRDARGRWYLHDMNSKNGTFLNGEKLDSNPVFLNAGDVISIAKKVEFIYGHEIMNDLSTQMATAPVSQYGIIINSDTEDVFIDSVRITPKFTPKEFAMLSYITSHPERICKYRELYAVVFSERPQPGTDSFLPDDVQPALYTVADSIRKKLKKQNITRPVIKARNKVGYQLIKKGETEE
ncbi:MAG: FHA domain-containing protein [Anaerolineaceae bacterium]|nr:FHA domain-containing protein [Anaerolineaceae bacterium]